MTRRHRIHGNEVPEVIRGLVLRLREHMETKEDLTAATLAFRALYRLEEHKAGRPIYPPHPEPTTWGYLEDHLVNLKDQKDEDEELLIPLSLRNNGTINP